MKHMEFRTRTGRYNVHTFEAAKVRLKLLNSVIATRRYCSFCEGDVFVSCM
jgi:hypothetical protein